MLAGGRSTRMGTAKAELEWHGSTLLRRITGLLARAVDGPVVVVRAPGQKLPELRPEVEVAEDPTEGLGPLQGLAAGLAAVGDRTGAAFVCSTDLPFLHPAFIRRVLKGLEGGADVALPHARGYPQPLAAAYRTGLAPAVDRLVAAGRLRPAFLWDECTVERLDDAVLTADPAVAAYDPELESVVNVNTRDDYDEARARPAPEVTVSCYGPVAVAAGRGPRQVRAATLAAAAAGAGVELNGHVVAALNGDQITRDGEAPLVAGDDVAFLAADAGG